MAQGFAFGTGSALAREAVGSVMGAFSGDKSAPQQQQPQQAAAPVQQYNSGVPKQCEFDNNEFLACLQRNSGNVSQCDSYYQALQSCQARL